VSSRIPPRVDLGLRAALCAAAAVALFVGWVVFWFQCDDAYIAFRYVSNSLQGWGYTWNPPPFRAVEGYTSFLWVVLLDGVWRGFGIEPPVAANWLSLGFSAGSLALVVAMVLRLRLSPGLAPFRTLLLALVLLGVLSNRTFLAWTSSGLETALFGCLLLSWVYAALFLSAGVGASTWLSLTAGLLALTRPDGLLFVAVTAGILGVRWLPKRARSLRELVPALPLLIPVVHVLWRRAHYGYWLPNTYYAKQIAAWPEAGVRYFAAFLLEYAYWIALGLALVAGVRLLRSEAFRSRLRAWDPGTLTKLLVGSALGLHFAYYTFLVGGDHFEFRVYQHWVPLVMVGFAALGEQAGLSPRKTLAALVVMILIGWPLPWLHWRHTRQLEKRSETFKLRFEVAPLLPAPLRWYGAAWDGLEGWLIEHLVGMRHQEHKVFGEYQTSRFPSRAIGSQIGVSGFPVMAYHTIGVPGWVLPHVAIIDWFGLNDVVIAHAKPKTTDSEVRQMAHDRGPPVGYFECFRPNVFVHPNGKLGVRLRARELTAQEIHGCEERFLAGE
jgi:arabinofuranosyltransferase